MSRPANPPLVFLNGLKLAEGAKHTLGGNYYHVQHLAAALAVRPEIRLVVLCDEHTHEPLRTHLPEGATRRVLLRDGGVIAADLAVARWVRRERPDIYHRPTGQLPFLPLPCRTVATIADLNFTVLPMPWLKRTYKLLSYRWTVHRADRITCVSRFTRDEVIRHYGVTPDRVQVVLHGANPLPEPDFAAADALGTQFFLTFGHQAHKNVETAVRALAAVRNWPGPTPRLAVVGLHPHLDQVVAPLARQLNVQVRFLGRVSDHALHGLYRRAAGLVFLSRYEGFGLPVLEAMQAGCPVICSNVCSLPEVAGEAAVVVAPDDVPGVGEALSRFLTDPGYAGDLRERGHRQAAQFTWEAAARKTVAIYSELLGLSKAGPAT